MDQMEEMCRIPATEYEQLLIAKGDYLYLMRLLQSWFDGHDRMTKEDWAFFRDTLHIKMEVCDEHL